MAAFARKHEVTSCMRYADRHSKACARPKRHERCPLDRCTAAHLEEFVKREVGQGPGNRFKIID